MAFTQNYYGSIGTNTNIENQNGTLTINGSQVLTANSSPQDLAKQLKDLVAAVQALPGVDADTKTKVTADIQAAEEEANSDRPKGTKIKDRLDKASGTLKSAGDAASSAFSLAKVLIEIGKWAIAIFV
jgi:hypothetical protein